MMILMISRYNLDEKNDANFKPFSIYRGETYLASSISSPKSTHLPSLIRPPESRGNRMNEFQRRFPLFH